MSKYGGSWDAYKRWLDHEIRMRQLGGYGDIFYVDATNGDDDTGDGTLVTTPYASLEAAIDAVTDNNGDTIIHKGYENLTAGITVDKDKLSILGWGLHGSNPYYPEIGSIDRSTAEDAPVLGIEAEFVEIAGLAFNGVWSTSLASNAPLEIMDTAGNKTFIHHCFFPDWARATMRAGIRLDGCHYVVIEDCNFHSVYGNMDAGIYIESSVGMPAYQKVKRCNFMGGSGVMTHGIQDIVGSTYGEYEDLKFANVTYGFGLPGAKDLYTTVKGVVGTMGKAEIFESALVANDSTIGHLTTSWKLTAADCWGSDGPLTT